MAKEYTQHQHVAPPVEVEQVTQERPRSTVEIDAKAAAERKAAADKAALTALKSEYTRCWDVKQSFHGTSYYGGLRVLADTKEEAIEEFCRVKCVEADAELRKQIMVREVPFVPAATEVGKPGGWKRGSKVRQQN